MKEKIPITANSAEEKGMLREVCYVVIRDEDDPPAMPGFLEFLADSHFCFNFEKCKSVEKALKGYDNEKTFVIYNETTPFKSATFKALANKKNWFGFEKLVVVSTKRPEFLIKEEQQRLLDEVLLVSRMGSAFQVKVEKSEEYFSNLRKEI